MATRSEGHTSGRTARGKASRSGASERKLTSANLADHERMIANLFLVILEFAKASGVSPERTGHGFARARRSLGRSPYRLRAALDFAVMQRISEALKAWYTEPDYLDLRGTPAPLPLSGSKSVSSLLTRFLPNLTARDIVEWLITEKVLKRLHTGHLVPLGRTISFVRPNAMTLDRIPFLLQALLSSVSHNTWAKATGRDTRCERLLALDRLHLSAVPHFNREVKKLVAAFLNHLESWAAPYLEPEQSRSRRRTARVGVEIFAYVEPRTRRGTRS
jgi:Family of unknown function (DUF6502)